MEDHLKSFRQDFVSWMETLNYASATVAMAQLTIAQLEKFLKQKEVNHPEQITALHLHAYVQDLKTRPNLSRGGGLSSTYINKQLSILRLYQEFLQHVHEIYLPLDIDNMAYNKSRAEYLTVEEVKSLYNACDLSTPEGYRDRALLAIYYGCGLRRSEGTNVKMNDVQLDSRIIHVRKTKSGRERQVPMATAVHQDLMEYVLKARPVLNKQKSDSFLLISNGDPLTAQMAYLRVKSLVGLSSSETIKSKAVGVHTLRHSLATHLLVNGMKIQKIARMLGHATIATTQHYTHITKQP